MQMTTEFTSQHTLLLQVINQRDGVGLMSAPRGWAELEGEAWLPSSLDPTLTWPLWECVSIAKGEVDLRPSYQSEEACKQARWR